MRLCLISDTHCQHDQIVISECDILIHAGDATFRGTVNEINDFLDWFVKQPAKHKIFVPGNHDWFFDKNNEKAHMETFPQLEHVHCLINQGIEIGALKLWGSPYVPRFGNWAFMRHPDVLRQIWSEIPENTDILITHGPPHGRLDLTRGGDRVRCEELALRIPQLKSLKLHVFGHIHEGRGVTQTESVTYANASVCTIRYKPENPPILLEL